MVLLTLQPRNVYATGPVNLEVVVKSPEIGFFTVGDDVPIVMNVTNYTNETRYFNVTAWLRPDTITGTYQGDWYIEQEEIGPNSSKAFNTTFIARFPELWRIIIRANGFEDPTYVGNTLGNGTDIKFYIHPSSDADIRRLAEATKLQADSTSALAQNARESSASSETNATIATVITILLAAGSIIGTYLTNKRLERIKDEQQKIKEQEKERQYVKNVRDIVILELMMYSDFIDRLNSIANRRDRKEIIVVRPTEEEIMRELHRMLPLQSFTANPHNYQQLSSETRARVFTRDELLSLERIYSELRVFRPRGQPTEGAEIEFNENVITPLRRRIESAISMLQRQST